MGFNTLTCGQRRERGQQRNPRTRQTPGQRPGGDWRLGRPMAEMRPELLQKTHFREQGGGGRGRETGSGGEVWGVGVGWGGWWAGVRY